MSHRLAPLGCKALGFVVLVSLTALEAAPTEDKETSPTRAAVPKLALAQCLDLALAQQPRIAARRASLEAAENGYQGLTALLAPDCLVPELPVRRSQAALGLTIARAALAQAQRETTYSVTRAYFTVVFASEQERVTRRVVEQLSAVRDTAKQMLDAGARDVTTDDVNRALVFIRLAQTRRTEVEQGVKRALAALKEALGVGPGYPLDVAVDHLPDPGERPPAGDEVIAQAQARRSEVIIADTFAQIACLEADAQATSWRKRLETFAAGADIHAHQVPQAVRNSEYRPGAVPPEMPTMLVGPRSLRVQHAKSLHQRALAVVDVTRNLIALQAEDAFLRWEQAALQARQAREAADVGGKLADKLRNDFIARLKVRVEDVSTAQVTAAQARGQYNEFLYRKIVALAELERVTAGYVCGKLAEVGR
jgi:outer membrane protein TolC